MTASEIRTLNENLQEQILASQTVAEHDAGFQSLALSLLAEIAAQLAEMNQMTRSGQITYNVYTKEG